MKSKTDENYFIQMVKKWNIQLRKKKLPFAA